MNADRGAAGGGPRKRLLGVLEKRHKISVRMYLGIGVALLLFVAASINSWFAFNTVADTQRLVVEHSLPQITGAFAVAEQSGTLVAAAPRLAAAGTLPELEEVRESVTGDRRVFESLIDDLERQAADDQSIRRMRSGAAALLANIEQLDRSVEERFLIARRTRELQDEVPVVHESLRRILGPAIDDQYFFTITGYRDLDSEPAARERHMSELEMVRYRRLADLDVNVENAVQLLDRAFSVTDPQRLEPLLESFESASEAIARNLASLRDPPEEEALTAALAQLLRLGSGAEAAFALRRQELELAAQERRLLADNRSLEIELSAAAEGMVDGARDSARASAAIANETIDTGRTLLLSVTAAAIAAALLMGSLFVGGLLRRLEALSRRMRRMAAGDLKTKVDVSGRDEVADMAAALEVFREASLKAQRLDLMERMAQELRDKNVELEQVLEDLKRAQNQIVMREKLAELGELTAGVAHEIQNPLNFVKNFSEVSVELLDELREVIKEGDGQLSADDRGLLEEICGDVNSNLERIQHHGQRANRIVRDMLKMGRGTGEAQPTDINSLLEEHARLAYHSARAADQKFNLSIKEDLSSDVKEMNVVSQELGRVFLNIVTNACHATHDRRQRENADGNDSAYEPCLWLKTRRTPEAVEIAIRDNGGGIPDDILGKIFNPFFTTKPTDQGTGLGLALSNDIVRQHGGEIAVDTEAGQTTEITVRLPLSLEVEAGA
ncbi:ATP-binding protein [Candidatus Foliamicus sp.]